jgi:hypothetical protein
MIKTMAQIHWKNTFMMNILRCIEGGVFFVVKNGKNCELETSCKQKDN